MLAAVQFAGLSVLRTHAAQFLSDARKVLADETAFNDTSGTYTVSLRLEISFVGVQQSQIFCVSILTYEIGGVPTMIDNTPRMADIGLSYSGRFIDCASRWHGEDLLTGEIFATVPIEYFYDPP